MPEPFQAPRMIIALADYNPPQIMSRLSCCDSPSIETHPHTFGAVMDGVDVYCANCDTTLVRIRWNKYDMEDYRKQEETRREDEAYAQLNKTRHIPARDQDDVEMWGE